MATKPTLDDARWAETGGGTPAAGITAPSSGKKDVGWVPGEKPAAQIFNHILHEAYKWFKYLSDGAFTGTHSFAGSTSFAGGLTGDTNSTGDFQGDDFYHTDTLELIIMPADFKFAGTDWTFVPATASATPASSYIESGGGGGAANAVVHLPTDAVISSITLYADRQGNTLSFAFIETDITVADADALVSNTGLNTGTGITAYSFGPLSIGRIGQGTGDLGYEIAVSSSGASAIVSAVKIEYTRPRP